MNIAGICTNINDNSNFLLNNSLEYKIYGIPSGMGYHILQFFTQIEIYIEIFQ